MLVVAALGGNALLRRGDRLDADVQMKNAELAASALARIAVDHRLVVTHGNGPQVGLLALQNAACTTSSPYPLDVLDAETEGMVGYVLEQRLGAHLDPGRLASLLTQVVVDPADPAFSRPTKPIGPVYDEATARGLRADRGWDVAPDGTAWRRVVASPEPRRIVEIDAVRLLVDHGFTVVGAGGGGIPVVAAADGRGFDGVEAVIDKDLSAALLATELGADALLLLTDVDAVYTGYGTAEAAAIHETTPHALRSLHLPAGSMGPKVEAVCRFVEAGGRLGAIGSLDDAAGLLRGTAGTTVRSTNQAL